MLTNDLFFFQRILFFGLFLFALAVLNEERKGASKRIRKVTASAILNDPTELLLIFRNQCLVILTVYGSA